MKLNITEVEYRSREAMAELIECWRHLKSGLRMRPVFHRKPWRKHAHISIAVVAAQQTTELSDKSVRLFTALKVSPPPRIHSVKATASRRAGSRLSSRNRTTECVRVVLDNLSTHLAGALCQAFAPEEVRPILNRIEFHFTPKHAS